LATGAEDEQQERGRETPPFVDAWLHQSALLKRSRGDHGGRLIIVPYCWRRWFGIVYENGNLFRTSEARYDEPLAKRASWRAL
jgi:hypothetical protein